MAWKPRTTCPSEKRPNCCDGRYLLRAAYRRPTVPAPRRALIGELEQANT